MKRTTLRSTAITTLAAFGAICFAPRGARADDVPGPGETPRAAVAPQPPAAQPQPQPAYPAYPPGYQPPPAYQPPPGYQNPPPYPNQYPPGYQAPPPYGYPGVPQLGPMRMKLVERPRYGMAITGAAVFGGLWITTALIAYSSNNNAAIVPIIGPLFYLRGDDAGFSSQTQNRLENVGLMLVTLGQATGAALFIAGMVAKQKVWVRETEVTVVPTLLPNGGGGLAAVGRF